jgi:hypothetical protein
MGWFWFLVFRLFFCVQLGFIYKNYVYNLCGLLWFLIVCLFSMWFIYQECMNSFDGLLLVSRILIVFCVQLGFMRDG